MKKGEYTKTEIQEGERKKEKLLKNLKDISETVEEICMEIEEGKEELETEDSEEKKQELQKYVSEIEFQISALKNNINSEHDRITSINVNYDEFKTEPTDPVFNNEMGDIGFTVPINGPLMQMFVEYINYLNFNKIFQKKSGITIKYVFNEAFSFENKLNSNISNSQKYDKYVLINFKNTDLMITLRKFYQDNKYFHIIHFESKGSSYLNESYLYKKLLFNAVSHSSIKGKYLVMQPNSLHWEFEMLEKRDFSDIFLPEGNHQDLQLYISLFEKSGRLLRYLMIGNPGTGKTESTIAIANLLKQKGVTVIKTSVCKMLKDKVELAELLSPSIIILDDIDLSLGSRSRGQISPALGDFLNILDGTEKLRKDVGIIATTNSLELLDLAAQRPGRFDKLLSFDSLTKDNIKNIILKSLRYGFGLEKESKQAKIFTHVSIIDELYKSRVTGSHIYNTAGMLMTRIDTLELEEEKVTSQWILNEIKNDIKTTDMIRKTSFLSDKMSKGGEDNSAMGFGFSVDNLEETELIESPVFIGGYGVDSDEKTDEKTSEDTTSFLISNPRRG